MCGIYGFKSQLFSQIEQKNILTKMGKILYHRGPDDSGEFINQNLAMGMRRLSIIDVKKGKQPIYSNDKNLIIVFNGEIYNYKEIRRSLEKKGYKFRTNTDTEVIVNLYQDKGLKCLDELNGMFSFAIYDINKDEVFIARDRFGIKPLYYSFQNNEFIFSSELKGITQYPNVELIINLKSLDLYLTMESIPAPLTIYKNIFKLEQGCYLLLRKNKLKIKKWYSLNYQPKFKSLSIDGYIEKLDYLIDNSVKLRTISDVPLGAFLSGGIDSSLICYYLSRNVKKVNTFSIGFEDNTFDESTYAEKTADFFNTNHHKKIFSPTDLIQSLPSIIDQMDEPFADASLLPTYLLSKFTREKVTVSLSGDGADEVFGGYPTYYARKLSNWIPKWSHKILQNAVDKLPVSDDNITFDFKAKTFMKHLDKHPDLRHIYWLGSFDYTQKRQVFGQKINQELFKKDYVQELIKSHMINCNTDQNWERSLWLDMRFYLQDNMLTKVDRASMMNSLEARVPFLDHRIVEYVARIPSRLKYKGSISKYILKKVASNHLPNKIINRKKKGFGIPIAKWIKNDLRGVFEDTFLNNTSSHEYFNSRALEKLLMDHLSNKKDNRKQLWTLFIFMNWHQTHSKKHPLENQ